MNSAATKKVGNKSSRTIRKKARTYLLPALVLVLGSLVRIHQMGFEVAGPHEFRQTQTAFAVKGFIEGVANPIFSYLPVFGEASQVPYELPIFQAISAFVASLGFGEAFAGRFVSFFMFQVSAILSWLLVKRLLGSVAANVSLIVFQFAPFAMVWGAAYLIESTALACTLASIILLEMTRQKQNRFFIFSATVFAMAAFLVKITTPVGWFAAYFFFVAMQSRVRPGLRSAIAELTPTTLVGAAGLGAALVWTHFANTFKEAHPITTQLTSSALQDWNFGSIEQRTDLNFYLGLGANPVYLILGAAVLMLPLAWFSIKTRQERIAVIAVSLVSVVNVGLFINLYYIHEYYFLAIFPSLTALVGWAVSRLAEKWTGPQVVMTTVLTSLVLVSTWLGPMGPRSQVASFEEPVPFELAEVLSQNTGSGDRLIVLGCDWNPAILYHSERTGLMLPSWHEVEELLWTIEDLSTYSYIVTCEDTKPTDVDALSKLSPVEVFPGFLYSIQGNR